MNVSITLRKREQPGVPGMSGWWILFVFAREAVCFWQDKEMRSALGMKPYSLCAGLSTAQSWLNIL